MRACVCVCVLMHTYVCVDGHINVLQLLTCSIKRVIQLQHACIHYIKHSRIVVKDEDYKVTNILNYHFM